MGPPGQHWVGHVLSFIATMRHEIVAIRLLARDGIAVGDVGSYSPLPEKDAIEPLLKELETKLDGLEQALSLNSRTSAVAPESATRFALRIRLDMLADELSRNLSPKSISRGYGAVPEDAARKLNGVLPELEGLVAEINSLIRRKGGR